MSKDLIWEWKNIKSINIIRKYKNFQLGLQFKGKQKNNPKWPEILDHPHRILIIGGSGSGKTNALLNLITNEPDIDKSYLCAKDPYEAKDQLLINKRENTGLKYLNDPKACLE